MVGLAAVVLAAGASTRMGQPKALIEWGGETFLRRVVRLAEVSGCAPIIVVEGAIRLPDEELGSAIRASNHSWPMGQLSSLQVGIAALVSEDEDEDKDKDKDKITGIMVLAIDRPRIAASTCEQLALAHSRVPEAIWQPSCGGRRGHPIVYPRSLLAELAGLPAAEGPRSWLASPAIASRRRTLDVEDLAIFDNLDRPEDLAMLVDAPALASLTPST